MTRLLFPGDKQCKIGLKNSIIIYLGLYYKMINIKVNTFSKELISFTFKFSLLPTIHDFHLLKCFFKNKIQVKFHEPRAD